ncbi:MAG: 16S rRNA (guanine(527)-N(7))-methyltransferase RsmG [Treponema sp.]|nr:16S rRNA (guanine(527)-N(7))-methyltransferase RsmG [Treponema sp.]
MDSGVLLKQGIEILCGNDSEAESLLINCGTNCSTPYEDKISLLDRYIKEIELFNPAYGLVSVTDTNELIIKHILDSLAPAGIILRLLRDRTGSTPVNGDFHQYNIADAGSGAGLPGIPLAIAMNTHKFTLIERMGRRAGFLLNTKAALALSNITVEESELEKVKGGLFDLVTFRAFKPLEPKLLKTLFKVCTPGGIIAAYKGRREKIDEEMIQLEKNKEQKTESGDWHWEVIPYNVPFLTEERHLLVIKKIC